MFYNAFKLLFGFLKENGFPYKGRIYAIAIRNELLYSGFVLPNVQIFFVQKISFAAQLSIGDFFTRYAGLGYSLHCFIPLKTRERILSLEEK